MLCSADASSRALVSVHEEGKEPRPLDPRFDLRRHADGLNWGFAGAGPAQLALALAADVLGDDEQARAVYQRLKFLCGTPHKNFYAHLLIMRRKLTAPACSRENALAEAA